jgi:DNA invertase Pin-like site-specific DNA recombinase
MQQTSEIVQARERTVRKIPLKPEFIEQRKADGDRILRTAAYCRVSTDSDEQELSFEAQVEYYTDKIMRAQGWSLSGIFADEGLTGTSTKKRKEFNRMIRWCEQGKIDQIITKSVSRFARNTLDCLEYVRRLKRMGVGVIFEKEGINTLREVSEFVFTIHSSMAQAESESLSGNVKLGHRMSFKQGKVHFAYGSFLGYRKGDDGNPEIVPHEAAVVKDIYGWYLSGRSMSEISAMLTGQGVLTPRGRREWSPATVKSILTNEKYMGDAILQKTFVEDCLTRRIVKNTGQLPMYYVENSHEPIIDKGTWDRVQEEVARRSSLPKAAQKKAITELGKYSGKYALTGLLVCGECGSQYRRVTWYRKYAKKNVWRCISRLDYGRKYCKGSPAIEESVLHEAIVKAIKAFAQNSQPVIGALKADIASTIGQPDGNSLLSMRSRMQGLEGMLSELIDLEAGAGNSGAYDSEIEALGREMRELESRIGEAEKDEAESSVSEARFKEISEAMDGLADLPIEYDDTIVRKLIGTVRVISMESITVRFRTGYEVEVSLRQA